mmetsp:Transcript_11736/g.22249  ORF Transcript_11736/g.22249 Transcript_11736/m.22249 type:complete len:232 (-) Transcript_11736:2054-2749(-)
MQLDEFVYLHKGIPHRPLHRLMSYSLVIFVCFLGKSFSHICFYASLSLRRNSSVHSSPHRRTTSGTDALLRRPIRLRHIHPQRLSPNQPQSTTPHHGRRTRALRTQPLRRRKGLPLLTGNLEWAQVESQAFLPISDIDFDSGIGIGSGTSVLFGTGTRRMGGEREGGRVSNGGADLGGRFGGGGGGRAVAGCAVRGCVASWYGEVCHDAASRVVLERPYNRRCKEMCYHDG